MNEYKIGQKYKVTLKQHSKEGNIITISDIKEDYIYYTEGNCFHIKSPFSKSLILQTSEDLLFNIY